MPAAILYYCAALADISEFGLPGLEITIVADVRAAMVAKRSAMAAYESQVGDFGPFLAMPGPAAVL
jgi:hypothetical protein